MNANIGSPMIRKTYRYAVATPNIAPVKLVFVALAIKGIDVPITPVSGAIDVAIITPNMNAHIALIIDRISVKGTIGISVRLFPSIVNFTPPTRGTSQL